MFVLLNLIIYFSNYLVDLLKCSTQGFQKLSTHLFRKFCFILMYDFKDISSLELEYISWNDILEISNWAELFAWVHITYNYSHNLHICYNHLVIIIRRKNKLTNLHVFSHVPKVKHSNNSISSSFINICRLNFN